MTDMLSPMAVYGHSNAKPTVTFGTARGTQDNFHLVPTSQYIVTNFKLESKLTKLNNIIYIAMVSENPNSTLPNDFEPSVETCCTRKLIHFWNQLGEALGLQAPKENVEVREETYPKG